MAYIEQHARKGVTVVNLLLAALITANIAINNYAFQNPSITVVAGTAVTWTNQDDDPHTIIADDTSFASDGLGQGDSWTQIFRTPGVYHYHCGVHPFMKGTVVVTAPAKHT